MRRNLLARSKLLICCIASTTCLISQTARAVIIDMTASDAGGGVFHYAVSVTNDEVVDLAIVSLFYAPIGDPLIGGSLTGPAGFVTNYDSGLGIIDLVEGLSPFLVGTTTDGFEFDSPSSPVGLFAIFEAWGIQGEFFSGDINLTIVDGGSEVPETGSTLLLAVIGVFALACARYAQRRCNPSCR